MTPEQIRTEIQALQNGLTAFVRAMENSGLSPEEIQRRVAQESTNTQAEVQKLQAQLAQLEREGPAPAPTAEQTRAATAQFERGMSQAESDPAAAAQSFRRSAELSGEERFGPLFNQAVALQRSGDMGQAVGIAQTLARRPDLTAEQRGQVENFLRYAEVPPRGAEAEPKPDPVGDYQNQYLAFRTGRRGRQRPVVPEGYMVDPQDMGSIVPIPRDQRIRQQIRQIQQEAEQRRLTERERFTDARLRPASDEEYFLERDRILQNDIDMVRRQQQAMVDGGAITQEQANQAVENATLSLEAQYDRTTQERRQQQNVDIPLPEGRPTAPVTPEGEAAPEGEAPTPTAPGAATPRAGAPRRAPGAGGAPGAPTTTEAPMDPAQIQREIMRKMEESVGAENLLRFLSGQEQSDFIRNQAEDLLRRRNEEAERRQQENDQFRNRLQEFDDRLRDMRSQSMDPNRLFSDRALGVSMALGVAAGALQQTMLGILYPGAQTGNTALALVNDAVERDIRAQEFNLNRGVQLLDREKGILQMARELTNNDRDAREYALEASRLYALDMLDAIVRRNTPMIEAQGLLRQLEQQRAQTEERIAAFEHRVRIDNARALARGRGAGGGGGRRGEGPLTGARAVATAAVDDYNAGRAIPGTTSLYYTPEAVTEWEYDAQGNRVRPTTIRGIDEILGEKAKDEIERFGRNEELIRELRLLRQLYDADGALTPGTQARARLEAQATKVQGVLTRAASGAGASDAEAERASIGAPLPTLTGYLTLGIGGMSIDEARAAIDNTIRAVGDEMNAVVRRGGGRLARRAPRRPSEVSMTRREAQSELQTMENQEEAQQREEALERARRQREQRGGGGQ